MKKFWNLTKTDNEEEAARLDLFGIIGEGYWDYGFDEVSFKRDMEAIPDNKPLDIYINSDGGSVFAAIAIYNMIARHKAKVRITVSGIAASAATIITSAPNAHVIMPTGSMMMIHAPSIYAGLLNASQMRELADTLDKIGGSIVDIYKQKSNCSDEKIKEMMSTDTFLSASEAVELGFADELDTSLQVAAIREGNTLKINGLSVSMDKLKHIPTEKVGENDKEGKSMEMTFEQFKAEYPDLYAQAKEEGRLEGVASERERIKNIEEMALDINDTFAIKAKFEEPMDAAVFAVEALKREKAKKADFLNKRMEDSKTLGTIEPNANSGLNSQEEKAQAEKAELEAIIAAGQRGFEARNKRK